MAVTREIKYNVPQLFFIIARQLIKVLIWGRGTGKSTILAKHIIDCVLQMPRSSGALAAETYRQIEARTLPSTIAGLEQHGYLNGVHFFVGKRAPKNYHWPEPYEAPLDAKHAMFWWNGTVIHFLSQDINSSSRGLNIDWVVADEAARLDEQLFQTDVLLTNRGNKYRMAVYPNGKQRYFKDCPLHHSIVLATSQPITPKGRWVFKYEEQAMLTPGKVFYCEASAEDNRENLGDEYFENAKAIMPDFLYDAEVLNKRIKAIQHGFYPLLDQEVHTYNQYKYDYLPAGKQLSNCMGDGDLDIDQPLIIGIDWGAKINCLVACQRDVTTFRVLKNFFVLAPKIINDLADMYCDYYAPHNNKVVYCYYDPTGNNRVANSRTTYAEQLKALLVKRGWRVHLMTGRSRNVLHQDKYMLWQEFLTNHDMKYPKFAVNLSNCNELWISMNNAPAKQGLNDAVHKDKKSERDDKIEQQHATHFSDALDVIVVDLFIDKLHQRTNHMPTIIR